MTNIFQTFKPINLQIRKYVEYYYLDIKENNITNEYECFPHFNNTISLYKSNILLEKSVTSFQQKAKPLQIFTPIREKNLAVKQIGKVHRLVIVFKPFGINQFYKDISYSDLTANYSFFSDLELSQLFQNDDLLGLSQKLDKFLLSRLDEISNNIIENCINTIFKNVETFSVEDFSTNSGLSRKHINRVFKHHIGVSLKKFQQIVLFRKTLELKLKKYSNENFTEIAHELNFSDQSHLNKMYKNFTKYSPKYFFQEGSSTGQEDIFWHFKN